MDRRRDELEICRVSGQIVSILNANKKIIRALETGGCNSV